MRAGEPVCIGHVVSPDVLEALERAISSFGIYLIGFLILVSGLAYAAFLLGAPPVWIGTGAIVLIGFGIITGVAKTRRRDETATSE